MNELQEFRELAAQIRQTFGLITMTAEALSNRIDSVERRIDSLEDLIHKITNDKNGVIENERNKS